jgi:hypothetical protein
MPSKKKAMHKKPARPMSKPRKKRDVSQVLGANKNTRRLLEQLEKGR